MQEKINIITSCDNKNAQYILPQLASIHESLRKHNVQFFLLHNRISEENIQLIKDFAKNLENITFREIRLDNVSAYEELKKHGGAWPYEAYFWLCAHMYLPSDVERCLYIDAGDVIINGDISEYYFANFNDKLLIATAQIFAGTRIYPQPPVRLRDKKDVDDIGKLYDMAGAAYDMNAGSFVINIKGMRERGYNEADFVKLGKRLHTLLVNSNVAYVGDQGLANVFFAGEVDYFGFPETDDKFFQPYNFTGYFFDAYDKELWYEPKIIHYTGLLFKPWELKFDANMYTEASSYGERYLINTAGIKLQHAEYNTLWWKYCKKTPIYEELNARAQQKTETIKGHFIPICQRIGILNQERELAIMKYENLAKEYASLNNEFNAMLNKTNALLEKLGNPGIKV